MGPALCRSLARSARCSPYAALRGLVTSAAQLGVVPPASSVGEERDEPVANGREPTPTQRLDEVAKHALIAALRQTKGHESHAAAALGVSRRRHESSRLSDWRRLQWPGGAANVRKPGWSRMPAAGMPWGLYE